MSFVTGVDLSAIVIDIGSGSTKIGFAGSDVPSVVLPSLVGVPVKEATSTILSSSSSSSSSSSIYQPNPTVCPTTGIEYQSLVDASSGLIQDWEGTLGLLNYGIFQQLGVSSSSSATIPPSTSTGTTTTSTTTTHSSGISSTSLSSSANKQSYDKDLKDHPILLVEPLYASKAHREKWCEILMEQYQCPGVFMSRGGVLSIYANARLSGLSIDMGAGGVSILPVQEGYALMGGARRNELGAKVYGGNILDKIYYQLLQQSYPTVVKNLRPYFPGSNSSLVSTGTFHSSVASWHLYDTLRQVKEATCHLLLSNNYDIDAYQNVPNLDYTLPDGTKLSIGSQRYEIPELLFNPSLYSSLVKPSTSTSSSSNSSSSSLFGKMDHFGYVGLHEAIITSSMACDPEIRSLLLNNIILTGGHSKYEGIVDRLNNELLSITPAGTRPRITVSSPMERSYGSWIGGSILGSMGTIPDLWLTSSEYAEYGNKILHKKIV